MAVHNLHFTKEVLLLEVQEAIRDLSLGNASSDDGIPTDFFKFCEDAVQSDLLATVSEALCEGELSREHNKGIIALIPKGGDTSLIKNLRPITLLNSFYKVVAKVLARRLQIILPEIVRPNQNGFVQGRCIIDNIFMAQEAMSYAKESGQDLVLLLLDFEKAYDRISWSFV